MNHAKLKSLFDEFLSGRDRSVAFTKELEANLDEAFPEDEYFQELADDLASYRPGGGDLLYDEAYICNRLRIAKERLKG